MNRDVCIRKTVAQTVTTRGNWLAAARAIQRASLKHIYLQCKKEPAAGGQVVVYSGRQSSKCKGVGTGGSIFQGYLITASVPSGEEWFVFSLTQAGECRAIPTDGGFPGRTTLGQCSCPVPGL